MKTNLKGKKVIDCVTEKQFSAVEKMLSVVHKHPRIEQAIEEVEFLSTLGSNKIPLIVGPTGVGKSTLAKALAGRLQKTFLLEMHENSGLIPVVAMEAKATSEADFNWKLFYADLLECTEGEAELTAVEYEVDPVTNKVNKPKGKKANTVSSMRKKVEKSLKARGVKFLIIDEGGHFTNVTETKMKRQTDALKSLANCTGCQIILLGSYDILDLSRLSAQLARRTKEIHFSRYRIDSPDDKADFSKFLYYLEEYAQGFFGGLLVKNAELLQKNTLGCIGTLMSMLAGLVSMAKRTGRLSQELLIKNLQTNGQCEIILEEIRAGEERLGSGNYAAYMARGAA